MLGIAYGLNMELCVGCFVKYLQKTGLSGLSPDYFLGQAWPDLWPGWLIYVIAMNSMTC